MKIQHDGYGGLEIQTGDAKVNLDWDECEQVIRLSLDGLCHICYEEINDGSHLCRDCFEQERRWHKVHCETNEKH